VIINAQVNEMEVLGQIPFSTVVRFFGPVRIANFMPYEVCSHLPTQVIDTEYRRRHPNPSEMLDVMDDEIIIDYLLNKGYNIEM